METYENEYIMKPKKESPYADSPYECAYIAPETQETVKSSAPRHKKSHRGLRTFLVVLLLIACCAGTAIGVSYIWQNRMNLMEAAMDDKFEALKQLYSESQNNNLTQLPNQGLQTPGQVYAQNVNAVVAVHCQYKSSNGYGEGAGSGFVISADGYIVTNYHVVNGAARITVITHKGESLEAEVVGFESTNDVAVLKVNGEDMPYTTMGSSDKLSVGDQVVAIGNPLGELTSTLTVGYISAKDRIVNTDGSVINMLQTDAAINSGNSGGPLFNMNGQVIGIVTAKYSGNSGSGATIEGLGFAIPTDDVSGIISDLKEFGYVTGAYLGVYVRDVDSNAQSYGLPAGAFVQEAMRSLSADRAGIRAGDIIVNLGGYDVDSVTTLTRVLRRFEAGESTSVTVYRNGKRVYLTVTLDEKPIENEEPAMDETTSDEDIYNDWFFDFFSPF